MHYYYWKISEFEFEEKNLKVTYFTDSSKTVHLNTSDIKNYQFLSEIKIF